MCFSVYFSELTRCCRNQINIDGSKYQITIFVEKGKSERRKEGKLKKNKICKIPTKCGSYKNFLLAIDKNG